jgi:F-box and leucine-rich repeat protein 2/20
LPDRSPFGLLEFWRKIINLNKINPDLGEKEINFDVNDPGQGCGQL